MEWVQAYDGLSNREKEDVTRVVNRLLASTFLVKRQEASRRDFYFVERNLAVFQGILGLIGWEVRIDGPLGVCQAVNRQGTHRASLRTIDSAVLLILRLLYEEKRKLISIAADVMGTVQELQEKYLAFGFKTRVLEKKHLTEALKLCRRYQIIELLDEDETDPSTRFLIYPSILFAVRVDSLQELHARLVSYQAEPAENGEPDAAMRDSASPGSTQNSSASPGSLAAQSHTAPPGGDDR